MTFEDKIRAELALVMSIVGIDKLRKPVFDTSVDV